MKAALRTSAILWIIWGIVHVFAGVMTMSQNPAAAVAGIADGVDPGELLEREYPEAAGALIKQHGFNLAWIGLVTVVGGFYVWSGNAVAIFVSALVGGLADVGYFVFIDLGGFNRFMPGTVMTIFSAAAIALSFWAYFSRPKPT
ncbi:MAG: hypothetical protein AAFZ38_02405 [Myxococcota bacterium]